MGSGKSAAGPRSQSLDRRMLRRQEQQQQAQAALEVDREPETKTPILCNRYAMDEMDERSLKKHHHSQTPNIRSQSMPRQTNYGDRLAPPPSPPERLPYYADGHDIEMHPVRKGRKRERSGIYVISILWYKSVYYLRAFVYFL